MEKRYGRLVVVQGKNGGHFPFNNSVLIDDETCALIDPGAGKDILLGLKSRYEIRQVINTHYHFDHIAYNYLFPEAMIFMNERDSECFRTREGLVRKLGLIDCFGHDWADAWLERVKDPNTPQSPYSPQNRHEWWLSTARLDGTYQWGETLDFGRTKAIVIGAPGHTSGFSCFYFPDEGLVYTGDIDLTAFGPWCAFPDGDPEDFINSARSLCKLDADIYVTGHEVGVLTKSEFTSGLEAYLDIIEQRDQRVLSVLPKPLTLHEVANLGLFYGKRILFDEWVRAWEILNVQTHLKRLVEKGLVSYSEGKYVRIA